MELKTQPVLCCLGESVAAKPTQFVMERSFAAHQLDWQALTVEIAADDFEDAMAGIRAMKFQAVRFFPSYQHRAAAGLRLQDELVDFVGGITSAAWAPEGWSGWHNLGHGIRDECQRRHAWSHTICWIHGDSLRARSFLAALETTEPPKAIVLSEGSAELPTTLRDWVETHHVALHTLTVEAVGNLFAETLNPAEDQLVLVSDDLQRETESIRMLLQQTEPAARMLIAANDTSREWLVETEITATMLAEIDQLVAAEAYDFTRWTGQPLDLTQFRDAFDEYCDF